MTPAVTVVLTTYNYGRFLAGALDSVLGQSFGNLEVIVIDDGSTDDTSAVIEPFLTNPRVKYHRVDHLGQAAAKNVGIMQSRGPLVAFLDADDLWMRHKLERQVAMFQADRSLGVVYTRRLLMDEKGQELEYQQPQLHRGMVLKSMFKDNFVCFSSAMVRRNVFDDVGWFAEDLPLAVDYDLWLRVALRYRFDYVDEPLVKYRTGHASLSRRAEDRLLTALRIMERFLKECGGEAVLPASLIRRARAETYISLALAVRQRSRLAALRWHLCALVLCPSYSLAWKGLLALPFPEAIRRGVRRALGRPVEWPVGPAPSSINEPRAR